MFERTISTITWTLTVLLAFAFVGEGLAKLGAQPVMVQEAHALGIPAWLMYVTGAVEVAGAILVLFPRFAHVCAGIFAAIMVATLSADIAHGLTAMLVAPFLLLVLALAVGSLRGWGRPNPFAWSAAVDRR
jgi:uncharacterized membrane protein YphA (DoxX/SURF4 family)